MSRMEIKLVLEKSGTGYSAYSNDLPGAVTTGDSFEEVKENFNEVVELYVESLEEEGEHTKANELRNSNISYYLDLEAFFDYYAIFNKSELAKYIGINPSLFRRMSSNNELKLSEKKALQIKNGLHKLATELQQFNFA
ncbi:type II toxin-antitoxin system HicB family antitoxin [Elizabethkingia anophelis]|uniref:type II toxin-antitoxin system HicB family antitoxin n=1 Tax=Elizabethkingia anophelis TaxID=1117645 RepID=UPI002011DF46|nr:type II toxin-antitoxin system HicB family antitoxin [Elizabethkingia anophelis]MCL1690421.1 type II toxin-antitoxin system HicB family antitoxin [Elizabethkingia anophelis]MCT3917563.1 type II toxin-antitoxin system HicB family antitoxin [Elizabethkingia anophelis]MCT4261634.1 type II toxin-antitoxin system HicB family antitoxin [Elizabethkingia anophelis]MCT4330971.1 type II toxin-antitoxin system HicB family antitoxin [Elizabethkingia anophelis]